MIYDVFTSDNFEKEYKKLNRKYKSLNKSFYDLIQNLKSGNFQTAKPIPGFSHKVFKIRLGDKQRGKRGGYRVIYFKLEDLKKIYLLSIFSKSDKANISNPELVLILKRVKF